MLRRRLPESTSGIIANVLTAFMVRHADVTYFVTTATLLTGCTDHLFAMIDPSAPYWASGFPAACTVVLGAGFTFTFGTLFIGVLTVRAQRRGCAVPGDDADLASDLGQCIYDRVQQRAEDAVEVAQRRAARAV